MRAPLLLTLLAGCGAVALPVGPDNWTHLDCSTPATSAKEIHWSDGTAVGGDSTRTWGNWTVSISPTHLAPIAACHAMGASIMISDLHCENGSDWRRCLMQFSHFHDGSWMCTLKPNGLLEEMGTSIDCPSEIIFDRQ